MCLHRLTACASSVLMRWQRFSGRMSPLYSALFHLLLLGLLAANVAALVVNLRRLQYAKAHPVSSMAWYMQPVPPITIWLDSINNPNLNMSSPILCERNINFKYDADCLQRKVIRDKDEVLLFSIPDPLASEGPLQFWVASFTLPPDSLPPNDCIALSFLAKDLDTAAALTSDRVVQDSSDLFSYLPPLTSVSFCPPSPLRNANGTATSYTSASFQPHFSGFTSVEGKHSMSLDTPVLNVDPYRRTPESPAGSVDISMMLSFEPADASKVRMQWETKSISMTWWDVAAAVSSYLNISLTILAVLFPWRATFAPPTHRDFALACEDEDEQWRKATERSSQEEDTEQHEAAAEMPSVVRNREHQMREPMLA